MFTSMYDNNASKFVSIAFSMASVLVTLPMMANIVSFEANNHYRILIGRLISSNLISLILLLFVFNLSFSFNLLSCLIFYLFKLLFPQTKPLNFIQILRPVEHIPHDLHIPPPKSFQKMPLRQNLALLPRQSFPTLLMMTRAVQDHPIPIKNCRPNSFHLMLA